MPRFVFAVILTTLGCTARNPDFIQARASAAAVCVRAADGLRCATWAGQGFGRSALWSAAYADEQGWDRSPSYWGTLQTPDLDGDGRTDACGRSVDGLVCAVRPAGGNGLGPAVRSPVFADADGFAELRYAATLQFADVDGDGRADACARGPDGVRCALGRGDGGFGPASLVDGGFFSDANGRGDNVYGGSLELGDLDADGRADLCVRGSDGVYCARSGASGWERPTRWSSGFGDADGWNKVGAALSLDLVDVDGDQRADLCGRDRQGIVCALSTGSALAAPLLWSAALQGDSDDDEAAYATLRFGDLDGDGRADVCAVVGGALVCAISNGRGFVGASRWDDTFLADPGALDHAAAWSSLSLIDLNDDGLDDVCVRLADGIGCAYSTGHAFRHAGVSAAELVAASRGVDVAVMSRHVRRRALPANPTAVENDRPGSPGWWVPLGDQARAHEIEAYTDQLSYSRGATAVVRASTARDGDGIQWTLYRTGYYQGIGARRVGAGGAIGKRQLLPPRATASGPARCDWTPTFEVPIAGDAVSGVYVLRLDNSRRHKSYLTTFVVRDDARVADLVVQRSDFTDVAYNNWDGAGNQSSWYFSHSVWVSWDRPFRSAFSLGSIFSYSAGYFTYEYSFVRWLERQGFDVKYVSNADVHEDSARLRGAKAFLSVGHDEYWSPQMRDHVEAARDAGMHLGFFSSDTVDSVIRFRAGDSHSFSPNIDHAPFSKDEWADKPVDLARPPHDNPSDTLTGTHYLGWCGTLHLDCLRGGDGQPFGRLREADSFRLAGPHPALRNLGLGAHGVLPSVLGYEYEGLYAAPAALPFQVVVLAANDDIKVFNGRPVMVAYETARGAKVFNSGSMHWAHALDAWAGQHAFGHSDGKHCLGNCFRHENRGAQQLTMNVLRDFGARPATPTPGLVVSGSCDWLAPDARCLTR
jgi:hypothetical protein